jgi:hypothetical protein
LFFSLDKLFARFDILRDSKDEFWTVRQLLFKELSNLAKEEKYLAGLILCFDPINGATEPDKIGWKQRSA